MTYRPLADDEVPKPGEHWVEVTQGMSGWFGVELWMNPDGPFPEPYDTMIGRYEMEGMAVMEAAEHAQANDLPYRFPARFMELFRIDSRDTISPWVPITDPTQQKALGKLQEELGECTSAAARCTIQGLDGVDPKSGKVNRQWLSEEIADVLACTAVTIKKLGLDHDAITKRAERKVKLQLQWHEMM
jgi:phosphoribosyl-ATP pyrophosphohydrolase